MEAQKSPARRESSPVNSQQPTNKGSQGTSHAAGPSNLRQRPRVKLIPAITKKGKDFHDPPPRVP